ncbi:periplasmic heavy metal sensor [Roseivivax isoporae]|uniref:RNA polymerase sigma-70 factor n=1 Tax=Roseivivax isoporae LMG 25204 TaxID=1449351 RepID=X7F8G0_9RHOB|nr:periplasmic heavy metal sensor [Roseivivax isoporae]ETX28379.1 RNA polymerase sigma-70 factor [Roseivivax isoporae LMG 25204]
METAQPRRGRWMRIALVLSLAANLVVGGIVAGTFLREGPHRGGARGPDHGFVYYRAFTEEERRALRQAIRQDMGRDADAPQDRAARRAAFLDGYRETAAALRADPFDPAALDRALGQQNERATERRARGQEVLVEFLAAMAPEDRAAYAERLSREIARLAERR